MEKFVLKDVIEVPRMGLRALKYLHLPTKLVHLHINKPGDGNKVFSLAFKTNAPDKTGVPHILEHTTLCGSKKFPVRDPFFKMMTRSLANFMNALTAFDYTYYPFATTNKADYANLQQVYMDSVFFPLLKEQDFQQEGWRLEPADFQGKKGSPLIFKGVVYNEMKGEMSIPSYQYYIAWFLSIYPSMQYSAGDPLHIPDLKYENLVKYHREHYHPSNCFTYSYGDIEAEEVMKPLNKYLEKFTFSPHNSYSKMEIPQPIILSETIKHKQEGPLDPMYDANRQHKISLTWYVGESTNLMHTLVWRVLGMLLTSGHASPFHQALIDSGIGPEFSVNTGFEETPGQLMFTIGLQGIEAAKVSLFKETVFRTLKELVRDGFAKDRVDALLHQAELADREVDANFGISFLHKIVGRVFHPNEDFMQLIDNEKLLNSFKSLLFENPDLFKNEISKFLGEDKPYFQFEMVPSQTFDTNRTSAEKKLLADKLASMTEEEKATAIAKAEELEFATQEKQNLDVLPTVTSSDISKTIIKYPTSSHKLKNNIDFLVRETGTQGISYVRIMRNLSNLPKDLLPYLLLYTDALTNVGTKSHNMAELENLVKLNTGNLSAGASISPWGNIELIYGASALDSKLSQMYSLLSELITEPKLDNMSKIKVILDGSAANISNSLSDSGHKYALGYASAALSPRKAAEDLLSGFSFVKQIQALSSKSEDELAIELLPKLEQIHSMPWSLRCVGLTQTRTAGLSNSHITHLDNLIAKLGANSAPSAPTICDLYSPLTQAKLRNTWATVPNKTMVGVSSFQVSHVGVAVKGCSDSFENKDHAALEILANLLTHRHLHKEIREKGGAYGAGAKYDALEGIFSMFSYRDPTPQNTREVMQGVGHWATSFQFTERDIEEGKIGIFQGIDSPISPRNEILRSLGLKYSDEERQKRRENLLNVTSKDLNDVAAKYLIPNLDSESQSSFCVIGPDKTPDGWTNMEL